MTKSGRPDHVHVFFGMRPIQSLSNLMPVRLNVVRAGRMLREVLQSGSMKKSLLKQSSNGRKDLENFPIVNHKLPG